MVFLKNLFTFNKDYRYYLEKGDRYLGDERYADARDAFAEALLKIEENGEEDVSMKSSIQEKFTETGNRLGLLNLAEAEHALNGGDPKKAEEHLRTVMDLAEDAVIKEKGEKLLATLASGTPFNKITDVDHSCSSCTIDTGQLDHDSHNTEGSLSSEDRFALYTHTLPGDLPGRYSALGERFAYGCLLNRDGDGEGALKVFEELSVEKENDILDYEMAIIYYRNGCLENCESLLRRAIELNDLNPLSQVALVELLAETGRFVEAIPFLEHMINSDLIPDQARLLLGDVLIMMEDETGAVEWYSQVLSSPGYAKQAAEKLIPLLRKQGRNEEAEFLAKRFMKGCC
jgi:tetratricopeptide (TPR) repeat protein